MQSQSALAHENAVASLPVRAFGNQPPRNRGVDNRTNARDRPALFLPRPFLIYQAYHEVLRPIKSSSSFTSSRNSPLNSLRSPGSNLGTDTLFHCSNFDTIPLGSLRGMKRPRPGRATLGQ